jgi:GNAT superfamily N-acetyltransferase
VPRPLAPAPLGIVGLVAAVTAVVACGGPVPPMHMSALPGVPNGTGIFWRPAARADEVHLVGLRQMTFAGENLRASWSWAGTELVFQARATGALCDGIYRISATEPAAPPVVVSAGLGAAAGAFFLPGDRELVYASTHLEGPGCAAMPLAPTPGLGWAIRSGYDLFRGPVDGRGLARLTRSPGYDAEGRACGVDGSIVFTSSRDGDLELYRMDSDGRHVLRLTHQAGYDGGASFDRDCDRIVWAASRPRADDARLPVRVGVGVGGGVEVGAPPVRSEIWVANADGSAPMQVTYLDAASLAPSFIPGQSRIVFSSNLGEPRGGAERDLWAVDASGANLERITSAPGFDGDPVFSPDGRQLAFASGRATSPGASDINLFIAGWAEKTVHPRSESAADRILADVRYLADPERQGRGLGTAGLESAATYVESRLQRLGLRPAGVRRSYRQPFPVTVRLRAADATALEVGGRFAARQDFVPSGISTSGEVTAPMILAGHGVVDAAAGLDDYAGLDVRGKIVLVRRFAPASLTDPAARRAASDVRRKAALARARGARALLVVDAPTPTHTSTSAEAGGAAPMQATDEAPLPTLRSEGLDGAGLPVLFVRREAIGSSWQRLARGRPVKAALRVAVEADTVDTSNIVARLYAGCPESERLPGVVILGAHYDHLGTDPAHSLEPQSHRPHLGADDNASGTATLLEAARILAARRASLRRDVVVVAFSAEEEGVLGSTHFVREPPGYLDATDMIAMINLDMVGRLRDNHLVVLGRHSAVEWPALLAAACARAEIDCADEPAAEDSYGPSDQLPFLAAHIPVAHFFTGMHADYHRPSDSADKVNAAGAGQIAIAVASLVAEVANRPGAPRWVERWSPPPRPP